MLSIPRLEETKPKGVGIQVLKAEEMLTSNGLVGVQYAGMLEDRLGGEGGDILKRFEVAVSMNLCRRRKL